MEPRFNGCTLRKLDVKCPDCLHETTNGGNPKYLHVVEAVTTKYEDINVKNGDVMCISCGDDHRPTFKAYHTLKLRNDWVVVGAGFVGNEWLAFKEKVDLVYTDTNDCPTCNDIDPEGMGARHTGTLCPDCEK